jgi:hypothetical protein
MVRTTVSKPHVWPIQHWLDALLRCEMPVSVPFAWRCQISSAIEDDNDCWQHFSHHIRRQRVELARRKMITWLQCNEHYETAALLAISERFPHEDAALIENLVEINPVITYTSCGSMHITEGVRSGWTFYQFTPPDWTVSAADEA